MDLNFSTEEVAAIGVMLSTMAGGLGYVGRQLLAAKQDTIDRQAKTIEKQDGVAERSITKTEELQQTVRDQAEAIRDQTRNVEGLRAQMVELTRELIDRRPVVNEILEAWKREHGGGERRREDR